jgi:hypothetical protein
MRKYQFVFALSVLFFLLSLNSFSLKTVQVIVKGKVIDEYSGKPTEAQIEFKTSSGNKFKIKSNSIDGSYSQVFNAGETVDATFTNFDLIKTTSSFKVDQTDTYKEQNLDLKVKKLTAGLVAYSLEAFKSGEDVVNQESKAVIEKLEEVMTFNRNVKFDISVNAHDTYFKILKKEQKKAPAAKKGKKNTQAHEVVTTVVEPSQDAIKTLVDARLKKIEEIIKTFKKFQNRISISPDYSSGPEKDENSKQNTSVNAKVIVKEIKNQLE